MKVVYPRRKPWVSMALLSSIASICVLASHPRTVDAWAQWAYVELGLEAKDKAKCEDQHFAKLMSAARIYGYPGGVLHTFEQGSQKAENYCGQKRAVFGYYPVEREPWALPVRLVW